MNCQMAHVLYTSERNIIVKQSMIQPLGGIIFQPILDIAKHAIVH